MKVNIAEYERLIEESEKTIEEMKHAELKRIARDFMRPDSEIA